MENTINHAERSHSILSASGAHRWLACPPSALLEAQFPDSTSKSAAEGTLAHEVAELKLRNYFDSVNFGKRKLSAAIKKKKENPRWSEEMNRHTDAYLDYVKAVAMKPKCMMTAKIECRVYFGKYTCADPLDEEEGYGVADCILIGDNTIHVIDFKYGQSPNGRVSAAENPQMILYALGAYEMYQILYHIERVVLHIFQPRLPEGVSEWETPLDDLLKRGEYIKERAALAAKGEGEFAPSENTCRFCRVKATCPARAEKNVKLAFSGDLGKLPPLISNAQMGEYLRQGADVAKWLSDLQEAALKECLAGREVPGWKAVECRGPRNWTDVDGAFTRLEAAGVSEVLLWERKPLTPAQAEKIIGKKTFEATVGDMVIKQPGKPALVQESDKRPAVTNRITAAEAFGVSNEPL